MSEPLVGDPQDPEGPVPQPPEAGTPPAQPPTPAVSVEEFARMKEALEKQETNVKELTKGYQAEHLKRLELEQGFNSLSQMRQYELEASRRAAALQEPEVPWDEFGEDGPRLRDAINKYLAWGAGQILTHIRPQLEAAENASRGMTLLQSTSTAQAMQQIARDWDTSGYDEDTLKAIEGKVRQHIQGNAQALQAALVPGGGVTLAMYYANRDGLPIQSVPSETPPPSTSTLPSASGSVQVSNEVAAFIDRTRKTLGLPADWQPTKEEIEEIEYNLKAGR